MKTWEPVRSPFIYENTSIHTSVQAYNSYTQLSNKTFPKQINQTSHSLISSLFSEGKIIFSVLKYIATLTDLDANIVCWVSWIIQRWQLIGVYRETQHDFGGCGNEINSNCFGDKWARSRCSQVQFNDLDEDFDLKKKSKIIKKGQPFVYGM